MRRVVAAVVCSILVLGACSSAKKTGTRKPSSTSTSRASVSSTGTASTSTTVAGNGATSTTAPLCAPAPPVPATPVVSPATGSSHLLTQVSIAHDTCVDTVTFAFTSKSTDPPTYRVVYSNGPFSEDGSGAPVAVSGHAFIVVQFNPAYGYDYEKGVPTYTGPKHVTATGTHHVVEVAETGDFEATVTWVIGLDTKRPFSIAATGIPQDQFVLTVH